MANRTIPSYDPAGGIDPSEDMFLLWQNSTNTYRKISRNVMLGNSGNPVDTTSLQTLSNKTLDNSNDATFIDNNFTLQDGADNTKEAQFQLSGISPFTSRTYTLPDASSTLVDLVSAQTLSNKTLSSPTINSGTISGSTIQVDSISELTPNNGVSIDGVNLKDGIINTNGAVTTPSIANGAVTGDKLSDSGWLNLTLINSWSQGGSVVVGYREIGGIVYLRGFVVKNTASTEVCAVLPVGYRPTNTLRFPITSNTTVSLYGDISPDGEISMGSSAATSAFRGLWGAILLKG